MNRLHPSLMPGSASATRIATRNAAFFEYANTTDHMKLGIAPLIVFAAFGTLIACADSDGSNAATADPCAAVGFLGSPCYPNATCNVGLACDGGLCIDPSTQAGQQGAACYPNDTCNDGLLCESGTCVIDAELADAGDSGLPDSTDEDTIADASSDSGPDGTDDAQNDVDAQDIAADSTETSDTEADGHVEETPPGFVRIEAGTFLMGSPNEEAGRYQDEVQHTVTLTRAFLLQATEVTVEQYQTLLGTNPSVHHDCGAGCPVENVSWYDAIGYANALSEAEGFEPCYGDSGEILGGASVYECEGYRLPTEAEWEYAARAGTTTSTYAGNLEQIGCEDTVLLSIAWFCGNASLAKHPVGEKEPNAWGLYDMLGNIREWASDWYSDFPGVVTDPVGADSGVSRVTRGGDWGRHARDARAACRSNQHDPTFRSANIGFRVARSLR